MEKTAKRYRKTIKSKKDYKKAMKQDGKKSARTENESFFAGFRRKKKTRDARQTRGVQKITSNKLTYQSRTFGNAVKSEIASKDQFLNLGENCKALLNEDLFKFIDLTNTKCPTIETSLVNSAKPDAIEEQKTDLHQKSIFCEIEEQFQQIETPCDTNDNYLISEDNLKELIHSKLLGPRQPSDPVWAPLRPFIDHLDYDQVFSNRIVSNQTLLNQVYVLDELQTKFEGVPVAGTCLRRKFAKRCNELTRLQDLGGEILAAKDADSAMQRANNLMSEVQEEVPEEMEVEGPSERSATPENHGRGFPETSYHTPKNQKFCGRDFSPNLDSDSKLQPGIFYVPDNYQSSLHFDGGDDAPGPTVRPFICELPSKPVENSIKHSENYLMQKLGLSRNEINCERPKKLIKSERKLAPILVETSKQAPSPRRKLHYQPMAPKRAAENENLDNALNCQNLDFVRPLFSPREYGRLKNKQGSTASEGPHAFFSPNEYQLRKRYAPQTLKIDEMEMMRSARDRPLVTEEDLMDVPRAKPPPEVCVWPRFRY